MTAETFIDGLARGRGRSIGASRPATRRMRVLARVPLVDATARQRSAPLTVAEDGDRILGR